MKKEIEDIRHAQRGVVKLGFTGAQAACVLPHFLPRFKECCPLIDIVLEEAPSDKIEEMLVSGAIDAAILHPPVLSSGLECFELIHDRMVVVPRSNSDYRSFIVRKPGEDKPYLDIHFLEKEPEMCIRDRTVCEGFSIRRCKR